MVRQIVGVFSVVALLVMLVSSNVFAENKPSGEKTLKVVEITVIKDDYVYFPERYSKEAQLMPVAKGFWARSAFRCPQGYADKDGNIKIPICESRTYAGSFTNGRAIIYDENKKLYSVINTSGEVIFDFDDDFSLTGVADCSYFQTLNNDPNGMYYVYVSQNGNPIIETDNPILTIYDDKGNRTKKKLPYYRIGRFHNGVANLYELADSYIKGYFGGNPLYKHEYTPVASVNTKGEIFDYWVEEHIEPVGVKNHGFDIEMDDNHLWIIKNGEGREIFRYNSEKAFGDHYIINEKALLVPVKQKDGTTAHTLLDSDGNLYPEYQYSGCDGFGGAYENRFIARPYKTYAEKVAYANTMGEEGERWKHDTTFLASGEDLIIFEFQPYTIYELQDISETLPKRKNAIPTSTKFKVNGGTYVVPTYNINDENFLKIRTIAYMINGTSKQFDIVYSSEQNSVELKKFDCEEIAKEGNIYTVVGGEMKALPTENKIANISKQEFIFCGTNINPLAYNIDGSNFVRLRDIAEIIDFKISWDDITKAVSIDTKEYIE